MNTTERNTVILMTAHYLDQTIVREFHELKSDCEGPYSVILLYDNTKDTFRPDLFDDPEDYCLFDAGAVGQHYDLYHCSKQGEILPGNCIYPILFFLKQFREIPFVWRLEYDVRFRGRWNTFFDHFQANCHDLLATTLFRYNFRPKWNWWGSLRAPGIKLEEHDLIRGFLPIFRLSPKACMVLERAYAEGWKGHYEVSIPTILNHYGCVLEDIGGDGEFVDPVNKNRFYTNEPHAPGLAPGTFVCPPNVPISGVNDNMLYHPVK